MPQASARFKGVCPPKGASRPLARVLAGLRAEAWVARGSRGVVAFSGGPDSLCLLHLFAQLREEMGLELTALYVDHGLRVASAAEGEAALAIADRLGVAGKLVGLPVRRDPAAAGNTQAWARARRYEALLAAAASAGARWIALAHTADDQAETVLMRAIRGAGPRGLAGMAARRETGQGGITLLRPLLAVERRDIVAYLEAHRLQPVIDPTNESSAYLRNRLRQRLFPLLAEENPSAVQALCRLADNCREEGAALEQALEALWPGLLVDGEPSAPPGAEGPVLRVSSLRGLADGLFNRALQRAYACAAGEACRLSRRQLAALRSLVAAPGGSRHLDLPGVRASRSYDRLRLVPVGEPRKEGTPLPGGAAGRPAGERLPVGRLPVPGRLPLPGGRVLIAEWVRGAPGRPLPDPLAVGEGQTAPPLTVRGPEPGDRMRIGPNQHRKVARLLIDAKVPRHARPEVPLLIAPSGEILLMVGLRRAYGVAPAPGGRGVSLRLLSGRGGTGVQIGPDPGLNACHDDG